MSAYVDKGYSMQIPTETRRAPLVLIVEDDPTMQPLWTYIVEAVDANAQIRWVSSEEAAERAILSQKKFGSEFDLIIADVFLAGSKTGIDLWQRYGDGRSLFLLMSVISPERFAKLVGPGSPSPMYIQKPLNTDQCIEAIEALFSYRKILRTGLIHSRDDE